MQVPSGETALESREDPTTTRPPHEARGAGDGAGGMPALEACGLGRRHPGGAGWLLEDACLVVPPGDRLAIVGPSGAGKTVLLRALAMLDPLDAGAIRWRGRSIAGDEVPSFRKEVVYLHQRPALLDGTVEADLRHPFSLKAHRDKRYDGERALGLLGRLGRDASFLAKSSRDLSGGEAQVVALLRSILLDPAILLLDEPTASIDGDAARVVEGLVDRWLAEGRGERALIWVSHDLDQARRMAGRALAMQSGRLGPGG